MGDVESFITKRLENGTNFYQFYSSFRVLPFLIKISAVNKVLVYAFYFFR